MQTAMNIGTVVDKDSLEPLTDAIVRILEATGDQKTKQKALETLARMARVEGVTIQNCVINGDRTLTVNMDDPPFVPEPADDDDNTAVRVQS